MGGEGPEVGRTHTVAELGLELGGPDVQGMAPAASKEHCLGGVRRRPRVPGKLQLGPGPQDGWGPSQSRL